MSIKIHLKDEALKTYYGKMQNSIIPWKMDMPRLIKDKQYILHKDNSKVHISRTIAMFIH